MFFRVSFHSRSNNIGVRLCVADVQKPAPDFKGTAVVQKDFKTIQLSDYKGKYLVLFFYPLDLYVFSLFICIFFLIQSVFFSIILFIYRNWYELINLLIWTNKLLNVCVCILQYIRLPNGNCRIQWPYQRFWSIEHSCGWCFSWFSFLTFGMDQYTEKGNF